MMNPDSDQLSPAVSVSAAIQDGGVSVGSIASAAMVKPGAARYGVPNGADPLKVVVPSFTVKSIRQSTPGSGTDNTLTVSLKADFDLPVGSTVTIMGLTESQTADSASLAVGSMAGGLGTSGAWTKASGQLVLTAASLVTAGTECVLTFTLTNPDSMQGSPAVSVEAAIIKDGGVSVGSIASAAMDKPGTALYGWLPERTR